MNHSVILKIPEAVSKSFLVLSKKIERLESDANQAKMAFEKANINYLSDIEIQRNKTLTQLHYNEIKIEKFENMIAFEIKKLFNKNKPIKTAL